MLLSCQGSTYESIKSLGIDLIEDDVLRTEITNFYELTLDRISEAERRVYDFTERECYFTSSGTSGTLT